MGERIDPLERDPKRTFTKGDKEEQAFIDDWECGVCLNPHDMDSSKYHGDHITPHSHGGKTDKDNLQGAHPKCNRDKGEQEDYHPVDSDSVMGWIVNAVVDEVVPRVIHTLKKLFR